MTHLAVRATLDRCRDVPEAVAFLEGIPHVQCANLLVADAAGRIAAFEETLHVIDAHRPPPRREPLVRVAQALLARRRPQSPVLTGGHCLGLKVDRVTTTHARDGRLAAS